MRASFLSILILLAVSGSPDGLAQPVAAAGQSKAVPTVRQDIYRELRAGRQCVADGDFVCADAVFDGVFARGDLTSYERAQAWSFDAHLEFARGAIDATIEAYRKLLGEVDAPLGLVRSAHYALATLHAREQRFDEALAALDDWWRIAKPSAPGPFVLRAEIEYRRGRFAAALDAVDSALAIAKSRSTDPEEGWLQLRAAALNGLGDLAGAAEQLEALLARWPTRQYQLELAGLYSKLGNDERKHELYESAYLSGWLVDGVDLIRLAGFRAEAGRLQDALNVLEQNRDRGYLPDGDSLRVLIARLSDWNAGEPIVAEELETLLRNARLEQTAADEPKRLRL